MTSNTDVTHIYSMGIHPAETGLNPRMMLFVEEYVTGATTGKRFNATAAARAAGYATPASNPASNASKLLRHPKIRKALEKRLDELSMSAAEVLARISDIAQSEPGDIVAINEHGRLTIDAQKVLEKKQHIKQFGFDSNGNPKIEFHDSHAALRDLARIRGLLKEGMELTGPGGGPVTMTVQFVNPDGSMTPPHPSAAPQLPSGEEEEIEDWTEFE